MSDSFESSREHNCPVCGKQFNAAVQVCPADGASLVQYTTGELIGQRLDGKYLINSIISANEDSVVYKAVHEYMGRTVAVKMLRSRLEGEAGGKERFLADCKAQLLNEAGGREAILDYGFTGEGRPYLVLNHQGENTASGASDDSSNKANTSVATRRTSRKLLIVAAVVSGGALLLLVATSNLEWQLEFNRMKLAYKEASLESRSPQLLHLRDEIAEQYTKRKSFTEAIALYRTNCDTLKRQYGPSSVQYANELTKLVSLQNAMQSMTLPDKQSMRACIVALLRLADLSSDKAVASSHYESAYELSKAALPKYDGLRVVASLSWAENLAKHDRYNESLVVLQDLDKVEPSSSNSMFYRLKRGLATDHLKLGHIDRAERESRSLWQADQERGINGWRESGNDALLLATALTKCDKQTEALAVLRQAADLDCQRLGAASPEAVISLVHYVNYLISINQAETAIDVLSSRLGQIEKACGEMSAETCSMNLVMALCEISLGDLQGRKFYEAARNPARQAFTIASKLHDQINCGRALTLLGECERRLGSEQLAKEHLAQAVHYLEAEVPPGSTFHLGASLCGLSQISYSEGKLDVAEAYSRKAVPVLTIFPSHLRAAYHLLAQILHRQADLSHDQAKYEAAEKAYLEQIELISRASEAEPNEMPRARLQLGSLYLRLAEMHKGSSTKQAQYLQSARAQFNEGIKSAGATIGANSALGHMLRISLAQSLLLAGKWQEASTEMEPVCQYMKGHLKQVNSEEIQFLNSFVEESRKSPGKAAFAAEEQLAANLDRLYKEGQLRAAR